MVVKSATKKRLMELGVDEEYAHKLATDRNMADIKQLSIDEVANVVSLSKDDDKFSSLMDVIREVGATRRKRRSKKITINAKAVAPPQMRSCHQCTKGGLFTEGRSRL